jgi:peptidoglycan/xylan/chitin deacetylase (PgdA/CDA1 family)
MALTLNGVKTTAERRAKRSVFSALASPVIYPALQHRCLRNDPVTILCYHTLGADHENFDSWTVLPVGEFCRQIEYLKRNYEIVPIDAAFHSKTRGAGTKPRAVLTFDDGDIGLHTYLLGALKKLQVPVTIYVATRQIAQQKPFWFDRIINALQVQRRLTVDLRGAELGIWTVGQSRGADNWNAISCILEALKTLKPQDRETICNRIEQQMGNVSAANVTPLAPLQIHQLRELADCHWVTIGAHSHCHNLLNQIPIEEAAGSIETSRRLLNEWTGRQVRHFAYPNGNHTPALEGLMERMGFSSASALGMTLWDGHSYPYRLPRVAVGRYDDLNRFKLRLVGV